MYRIVILSIVFWRKKLSELPNFDVSEFANFNVSCNKKQKSECAIKISDVYCDGFSDEGKIGAFSHFHSDHISSLTKCIGRYDTIITHSITFQAIIAMKPGFRLREQWVPQDYDTKYSTKFADIRLLKANHIPGSSQIHVESDGVSYLYSGDFSYPGVQTRSADYLVLDATHGDPWYDGNTDRKSVLNRMFEDVKDQLESNRSVIINCAAGTLQEIIRHFEIGYDGSKLSHDIPFVCNEIQKNILHSIYNDEKKEFREIINFDDREFWALNRSNKKHVIFAISPPTDSELQNHYKIIVDRFRYTKGDAAILPFDGGCRYNLSSHASIEDIYKYVDDVKPKTVITDYSRSHYAKALSKLISQKFPDIKTYFRPPE